MHKCSYIVLIHNNEKTIPKVIDSLKKINNNIKAEFIIIDDGSTDNSLQLIKQNITDLPRATIITHEHMGPTLTVNQAISLAHYKYIHFVDGRDEILPDSTLRLIAACEETGSEVAFGKVSSTKEDRIGGVNLIKSPLQAILENKIPGIREIGNSGTLVTLNVLDKIDVIDNEIYTHTMSLSLKCAAETTFAFLDEVVAINDPPIQKLKDQKFVAYNNLLSIYNEAKNNPELYQDQGLSLLLALITEIDSTSDKFTYFLTYLISKYITTISCTQILNYYKKEIEKLF